MMSSFSGTGHSDSTSASLIERVRDRDEQAWQRLAELYTPLVYTWTRKGGLRNCDAVDVVQDVFRGVLQGIDGFRRDGRDSSFRGWLWSITRNQVRLFIRRHRDRPRAIGGDDAAELLQQYPMWFDQEEEPSSEENRRTIVHRALNLVRGDFSATTWDAFLRTTLQHESAAEVGAALGISAVAVRQAKFRVLQRLRQELDGDI